MEGYSSLQEIRLALFSSELVLSDVVLHYVSKINERKNLNAFIEVFEREALDQARGIQERIVSGTAGRLAGMVIAVKDNIAYKGHRLAAASRTLETFVSLYTATALQRLLDEDVIVLGRLNCDEFAMGGSNETSFFGPVLNPRNPSRVAGGSSGGSAAAVAAGMCLSALGSDTGGSVRQPASFCGVIGVKPTYGRVSRHGLVAFASSFDQIGILAKSTYDAALLLEIMAGHDASDATSSTAPVAPFSLLLKSEQPARIGFVKEYFKGIDSEISVSIESLLGKFNKSGYPVTSLEFPLLDYLVPAYYVLTSAEASSNLARYDGVHYGYRSPRAIDLESTYKLSRSEGFGKEVKRRVLLGTFILSAGYYDAYYTKGQKVRRLISDATQKMFDQVDFVVTPTTPDPAFYLGEKTTDPIKMYLSDIFNVQASLAGIPAMSIPLGVHSNGMPYGLQIMSAKFNEASMLACATQIEQMVGR